MSFGLRLNRLEQQTAIGTQDRLIRAAAARLRAAELPEGEGRSAVAYELMLGALDGLELTERVRDWDPDLRAALSEVFSRLTIDELRALRGAGTDEARTIAARGADAR